MPSREADGTESKSRGRFKRPAQLLEGLKAKVTEAVWKPKARGTPIVSIAKGSGPRDAADEAPKAPRPCVTRPGAQGSPPGYREPWHDGSPSPAIQRHSGCFCGAASAAFALRPSSGRSDSEGMVAYGAVGWLPTVSPREVPDFYMEGMSHDSTPCTDCRSFRSSICSSPPVPGIETFFPGNHRSSAERSSGNLRQVYYLYASPLDQPPIDVRSEVETIHEAFAESGSHVQLNVGVATVESLTKLLTLARSQKGLALHLSAHAYRSDKGDVGLVLEDAKGFSHVLWKKNLEEILGMRDQHLQSTSLLFLSTCWSQELAQVFVECGCPHVVSLRTRVHDIAARRFSQQFYLSLGVGQSLLASWQGARTCLRNHPETEIGDQSEHFILFGQHAADKVTLQQLCGEGEGMEGHLRFLEDASQFLDQKMASRPEHFLGRTQTIHEVMHHFSGHQSRRACALWGPEGIGKSALGAEFLHFAAAPGRHFSCSARTIHLEATDLVGIANTLQEELESLAAQMEVCLRPGSSDSRSSLCSTGLSARSAESSISIYEAPSDLDAMTLLLPLRQRLRRGFQHIERVRRRAPTLLMVDDEAGAVASSPDVRKLFGELLEHTCQLHILVLSRAPIYHSLGPTKVVNVPLGGLKEPDAAKLFLQRIHRMLDDRDFPDPVVSNADAGGGEPSPLLPRGKIMENTILRLKGHPLLHSLQGHPGKIREVASQVTPNGPSLMELAEGMAVDNG